MQQESIYESERAVKSDPAAGPSHGPGLVRGSPKRGEGMAVADLHSGRDPGWVGRQFSVYTRKKAGIVPVRACT